MAERLLHLEGKPLPPITEGEVIRATPNFQLVTDYQLGMKRVRAGERFIIEPLTPRALGMLMSASVAHNTYDFSFRPIYGINARRTDIIPCLQIPYTGKSISPLLEGSVQIPQPGESTVPSLDRMELCIERRTDNYKFTDDSPRGNGLPNRWTRHIKMVQTTHKDEIPAKLLHSNDPDSHYKVRKGWWLGVLSALVVGKDFGEFSGSPIIAEIDAFVEKFYNKDFMSSKNMTKAEDIEEANSFIDLLWQFHGNK